MPGRRRPADVAPTTYHDHPGGEVLLACPNCDRSDCLEYLIPATHYNGITAHEIAEGRVTYPQVITDAYDTSDPLVAADDKPSGIRCTNCKWGYTGPQPERRLVRQR